MDVALRCNVEMAQYLQWWGGVSKVPPPERDERGYNARCGRRFVDCLLEFVLSVSVQRMLLQKLGKPGSVMNAALVR